ncbi:MAG: methyltransferase domain-containing protein [Ghiorsea sp.]
MSDYTDFSFNKIKNFDEHIISSIPSYNDMQMMVKNLSAYFIRPNTNVYDIGCSTGKLLKSINNSIDTNFIGIDIEKENFSDSCEDNDMKNLSFVFDDIENVELRNASLVTSIFTLQFLQYNKRDIVLKNIYDSLNPGGAFIITEKVYANDTQINDMFTFSFMNFKKESFSDEQILSKEYDLRTLFNLLPNDDFFNSLNDMGFSRVETFWKAYNFIGVVCIK